MPTTMDMSTMLLKQEEEFLSAQQPVVLAEFRLPMDLDPPFTITPSLIEPPPSALTKSHQNL